jgi:hypothetical protein
VIRGFIGGLFAFVLANALAAPPQQIPPQNARFIGAIGCKSSSCHGGAGEKRSQFITWTRQDFHTRGYAILTNARSARMAESLGLTEAPTSSRCTICHSPFQAVSPARLTATADPRESVSCESCHGAAEPWLRGHTRIDWTYATRVGAGMRDLRSFYVRANTCVACHQNLDADIAAAGHPDLLFELDGQSIAEPKHWRDPDGSGPRAWLVGQAVALRETSWRLAQNSAPATQTLGQWEGLHWLLARVTAADRTLLPIDPNPTRDAGGFARTQEQADALARRAAQENFGTGIVQRLLRDLIGADAEFVENFEQPRDLLFRRGQRLVLALERLTSAENKSVEELRILRADLRTPADFQPTDFAAHLAKLRLKLATAP